MPRKVRKDAEKAIVITTVVRNSASSSIQKKRRPTQRGSSAIRRQRPPVKAGNNSKNFAALQQILPDTDDTFAGSDTPMSPTGLATELPQGLALEYYICHLKIKAQECCPIVTSNEQGAQCVAVASPKPGCYNTLLDTQGTAAQVFGVGTEAKHSYQEFQSHIKPCIHAKAVSFFGTEQRWLDAVADGDLYGHANEVMLDEHPVVIIRSGCMNVRSLLLSVCSNKAGWPRSLVGSTKDSVFCCYDPRCCSKRRRFKCDHCIPASEWLTSVQDQLDGKGLVSEDLEVLADMAADLEGMHLQSQHAATGAIQQED